MHWQRWRVTGDAGEAKPRRMLLPGGTVEQKFWSKALIGDGCWEWQAARYSNGYGKFAYGGRGRLAHVVAYEWLVGPVPEGMELDHVCRNRACIKPAPEHLEPVTHRENVRRGMGWSGRHARQTHCVNGHEFSPENTSIRPNGSRNCMACDREDGRRRYSHGRAGKAALEP